jgi:hypothetical protein
MADQQPPPVDAGIPAPTVSAASVSLVASLRQSLMRFILTFTESKRNLTEQHRKKRIEPRELNNSKKLPRELTLVPSL